MTQHPFTHMHNIWVKAKGVEYKYCVGVILGVDEDDLPLVGCVNYIYVVNDDNVVLSVSKFSTKYEPHYRAYVLHELEDGPTLVHLTHLFLNTPVHIRTSQVLGTRKFIVLPHALGTL